MIIDFLIAGLIVYGTLAVIGAAKVIGEKLSDISSHKGYSWKGNWYETREEMVKAQEEARKKGEEVIDQDIIFLRIMQVGLYLSIAALIWYLLS